MEESIIRINGDGEETKDHVELLVKKVTKDESAKEDLLESNLTQSSRFQVAKVTGESGGSGGGVSSDEDNDGENDDDDNDRTTSSPAPFNHQGSMDYTNTHTYYDTKNFKSLRHYTREALPRVDHYRDINSVHGHMSRPTLDELHGCDIQSTIHDSHKRKDRKSLLSPDPGESAVKFGWVKGVLVRCLVNIWGVMLFLRLSWVVAQAGIGYASLVILFATVVTVITALSMSAICTNGEVRGGGSYYMISRSLGPEFGGSIGVIFSVANAVAVAMYASGFAETVNNLFKENDIIIFSDDINSIRLIGCVSVIMLLGIALIGTEWEAKTQIILLGVLLLAMANFLLGTFFGPTEYQRERGFVGYDFENMASNFGPDFRDGEDFFSIFAIFFPAATGILAGANISGDLKDPQQAIPLGTLLGILITTLSYLGFAFLFGVTSEREVLAANGSVLLIDGKPQGIHHNYDMMSMIALYGPIITAGTWAAALSSALASLISAPKVFQALCKDKLFPYIQYFAKGYGKNNEPRRGYFLTFIIALGGCAMGDLNVIAPIISNFFLAAYCLINFSCFHASFAKSLGFRPSFRYYNMWVSLMGSILCLVVMFIINWMASLITFIICFGLYFIVYYRKPDVNWGSSTQAATYRSALQTVYKLNLIPDHIKTFRPQILVLSGNTFSRPPLVDFSYQIVKGIGLMICGHVIQARLSQKYRENIIHQNYDWLYKRKVKAFFTLLDDISLAAGSKSLIQCVGVGKLRPNIVMLGYKNDWQSCNKQELLDYFAVIHEAFDKHMSFCILRLESGLDHSRYGRLSHLLDCMEEKPLRSSKVDEKSPDLEKANSNDDSSDEASPPHTPNIYGDQKNELETALNPGKEANKPSIPKNILWTINQFQRKQKKSTIDVWWLYDDGGLTMLMPYILSTRKQWSGCKLRIFALANKKDDLNQEQRNMAALLSKFRIEYSDVTVISDIVRPPREKNRQAFNEMISKWRTKDLDEEPVKIDGSGNDVSSEYDGLNVSISDSEYLALKNKSYRHIRLRELLLQHSMNASLIVMTLPMPRKGTCSAALYMAWLETLTEGMPPFLLVRGAQQSVLTFYS